MTIIGLGIDIIKISRIKKLIDVYNDKLSKKILSKNEIIQYNIIKEKERFLAKRFAAKEASVKAFGIGIRNGITFKQFEIYNNKLGKPHIRYFDKVVVILAKKLGVKKIHLTITDEKDYACALVIIEN